MRFFLILFLSLTLLPVYAQENTTEQTSVDVQVISVDFNSILFAIIASILGSFIGGTLLGKYLSKFEESRRERKGIENLQALLTSDFATCKRLIVSDLKKQKKLHDYFLSRDKSEPNKPEAVDLFKTFRLNHYLPFRKIIEKSGTLIKLDPSEIKTIQAIYESFDNLVQNIGEERQKFLESNNDPEDVLPIIKYLNLIYHANLTVLDALQFVELIDWIDLDKEVKVLEKNFNVKLSPIRESEEIKQDWIELSKKVKRFYDMDQIFNEIKQSKEKFKKQGKEPHKND